MQIADIMPARGKNMHWGGKKKRRAGVAAQPDCGGAAGAFPPENAPLQRKTGRFIGRRRPFGEPVRHVLQAAAQPWPHAWCMAVRGAARAASAKGAAKKTAPLV